MDINFTAKTNNEIEKEKKIKASQSSMKSVKKRKANMTEDELKAWRKKQSEASNRSYKARIAAMTPEQLADYKTKRNSRIKIHRTAQKNITAELNADLAVIELMKTSAV